MVIVDGERLDTLMRLDEALDLYDFEGTVGMGDQGPGDAEDAGLCSISAASVRTWISRSIRIRLACEQDVPDVMAVDDGFFRDAAEASSYAQAGQMFLYETGTGLAGCGLLQRVTPDREAYDIGMMVAPAQRRRDLGRHIVGHLMHLCLSTGKHPIAGCSVANLASQRCLESAGFRSEHQLIEFAW